MIDWLLNQPWNGWFVICLYWIPLAICVFGYTHRTGREVKGDIVRRAKDHYYPSVRLKHVAGRLLGSLLPLVNCFCAMDAGSEIFDYFLDIPLVPKKGN